MDLTWLADFEALAETGNFSRAATARNVTQPAFSRRIRALEDWAGTPLFERRIHPVGLTDAGARLRPLLAEVARRLDEAREEAGALGAGSLRFAATHALSFSFFPAWLSGLVPRLPPVAIHLISEGLEACERMMLAGRADFLLFHRHPAVIGPLETAGFEARTVGRDRLRLVSAPRAGGGPLFPAQDRAAPYLGYGIGSGLARIVAAVGGASSRPVLTSHLAAALRTMAQDGRGLAWLPDSLIATDIAEGSLVPAGPDLTDIPIEICLMRPARGGGRARQAFWDSLAPTELS